jgi:hypothetical protein
MSDLEFYLPALGSLFIALAGALVAFLAWRMYRAWRKRKGD